MDDTSASPLWRYCAYAWAVTVAVGLASVVVRIPVQLTDSLANLIGAQQQSWWEVVAGGVGGGYVRPFLGLQIKLGYVLAGGHETVFFRALQGAQVVACAWLFVAAARVRTVGAALAVPMGVALFFGGHTFDGAIREAFPINSYLSVVLACLAAVWLSLGAPARWRDAAAMALLVTMLLTVETGGLVLVCLVAAWLTGARGVSSRAVGLALGLTLALLAARLAMPGSAAPGLTERPSGFGFTRLEPQALQERFGAFPYPFYAYNVVSQVGTVLFAEPRAGIWSVTASLLAGTTRPSQIVTCLAATLGTILIGWYAWDRRHAWLARDFTDGDRIMAVFVAVLLANAVVSFPYTKDVIVSPAGALHALAATAAAGYRLGRLGGASGGTRVVTSVLFVVLASAATVRIAAAHYQMRDAAFITRNDWSELEAWASKNHLDITEAGVASLARRLQDDALNRRVPPPAVTERQVRAFREYLE